MNTIHAHQNQNMSLYEPSTMAQLLLDYATSVLLAPSKHASLVVMAGISSVACNDKIHPEAEQKRYYKMVTNT